MMATTALSQYGYRGSASVPSDNGTNGSSPITITPPASMADGDLVYVFCGARNASSTFANSVSGGQSWTQLSNTSGTVKSSAVFWCRFNGTWGANPQFTSTTATSFTAVMHVFYRSTNGSAVLWALDQAQVETDPTSSPYTSNNITTSHDTAIAIYAWYTADDNTWSTNSGSGWTDLGSAQYRNLDGNDFSVAFVYKFLGPKGSLGTVSKTETANGPDDAVMPHTIWYWWTPGPVKKRVIQ